MNPGYLSLLLLCITIILFASGWKEILLRSISHKGILLFFVCWIAMCFINLHAFHIRLNLCYLLVLTISTWIIFHIQGIIQKLHLLSVGLLMGSFHFLLQEIFSMDPIMVVSRPEVDISIFLALLLMLLQRGILEQIASLSIGLMLGEFFYTYAHKAATPIYLGGPAFQDQWWLTLFIGRTMTIGFTSAYQGCKSIVKYWMERIGGWKK